MPHENVITTVLGDHPRTRILFALIRESRRGDKTLNATEIADTAQMARSTVYQHLPPLIDIGIAVEENPENYSPRYAINTDSEIAKTLAEFDDIRVMGDE